MRKALSAAVILALAPMLLAPCTAWASDPATTFRNFIEKASVAKSSPKASIQITEPSWQGGVYQAVAGETVPADPRVRNSGKTDFSEVALEVTIPLCQTTRGDSTPAVQLELSEESGWTLCEAVELDSISETGASGGTGEGVSYRLLYEGALSVGEETEAPYSQMIVAEGIDGALAKKVAIGIHAIALSDDGTIAEAEAGAPSPPIGQQAARTEATSGIARGGLLPQTGASIPAALLASLLIGLALGTMGIRFTQRGQDRS